MLPQHHKLYSIQVKLIFKHTLKKGLQFMISYGLDTNYKFSICVDLSINEKAS